VLYSSYLPLGVPNGLVIYQASSIFSGAVAGEEKEDFCEGSFSHAHPLLCFKFSFTLFLLASFYQKPKKIVSLVVVISLLLVHYVVP
jgi:hypothetical protein